MARSSSPSAWKTAPPYREPAQATAFTKKLKGTCHCGNVVYWLSKDTPEKTKFCHCTDCQLMHGKIPAARDEIGWKCYLVEMLVG